MGRKWIGLLALAVPAFTHAECPLPDTRIGVHEFPPLFSQTSGQTEGTLVSFIEEVMAALGCQSHIKFMPVPQLLSDIATGHVDLAMLIHHPKIETHAYYGKQPIGEANVRLYRHAETAAINRLESLPSGSRVIVRRGYGYNGLIEKLMRPDSHIRLVLAETHLEGVELLRDRKGDYLLSYAGPTSPLLQQAGLNDISADPIATWPIYMLLSKKIYNGASIVAQLDQAAHALMRTTATK